VNNFQFTRLLKFWNSRLSDLEKQANLAQFTTKHVMYASLVTFPELACFLKWFDIAVYFEVFYAGTS
jgi:hypothetical protein